MSLTKNRGQQKDRGGGREGKGSLNKAKKEKYAKMKHGADYFREMADRPKFSPEAPTILPLDQDHTLATLSATGSTGTPSTSSSTTSTPSTSTSTSTSTSISASTSPPYIDAGAGLLSRQFERDLNAVMRRARASNILACVLHHTDFSRAEEVLKLVQQWPGVLYCCVGVSPDAIKKNHDKLFEQRMDRLHDLSLHAETVGILCGLDLTRPVATHFLQHKLLEAQIDMAIKVKLPVVIRQKESADKLIEKLQSLHTEKRLPRVAIYDHNGDDAELKQYIDMGCYIIVTGVICDVRTVEEEKKLQADREREAAAAAAREERLKAKRAGASAPTPAAAPAVEPKVEKKRDSEDGDDDEDEDSESEERSTQHRAASNQPIEGYLGVGVPVYLQLKKKLLPLDRLLIASDSPFATPDNIEDIFTRQSRNEPSNLPYIYRALSTCLSLPISTIATQVYANTKAFYALRDTDDIKRAKAEKRKEDRIKEEGGVDVDEDGENEEEEEEDEEKKNKKKPAAPLPKKTKTATQLKKLEEKAKHKEERQQMLQQQKLARSGKRVDDDEDVDTSAPAKSAASQSRAERKAKRLAKKQAKKEEESDDDEPKKKVRAKKGKRDESSDEEEEDIPLPAKKGAVKKNVKKQVSSSESESDDDIPKKKTKGKKKKESSSEESSEDEEPKKKVVKKVVKKGKKEESSDESESEEEAPKKKVTAKTVQKGKKKVSSSSDEDSDEPPKNKPSKPTPKKKAESSDEDSDDAPKKNSSKSTPKKKAQSSSSSSESSESEEDALTKALKQRQQQKQLKAAKKAAKKNIKQEEDEDVKKEIPKNEKKLTKKSRRQDDDDEDDVQRELDAQIIREKHVDDEQKKSVEEEKARQARLDARRKKDDVEDDEEDDEIQDVDVDEMDENETIGYACKKCRKLLFTNISLVGHAKDDKSSSTKVGFERTHCEVLFVEDTEFARTDHADEDDDDIEARAIITTKASGTIRVDCPKCGSKLGRSSQEATQVRCSCGRLPAGVAPFIAIHKSRVDFIHQSNSIRNALSQPKAIPDSVFRDKEELERQEQAALVAQKKLELERRAMKKMKRQTRANQRGNFSEFRNKNTLG